MMGRSAALETAFGEILRTDFSGYRDEPVISTKAGYDTWPGPYGEWAAATCAGQPRPEASADGA